MGSEGSKTSSDNPRVLWQQVPAQCGICARQYFAVVDVLCDGVKSDDPTLTTLLPVAGASDMWTVGVKYQATGGDSSEAAAVDVAAARLGGCGWLLVVGRDKGHTT